MFSIMFSTSAVKAVTQIVIISSTSKYAHAEVGR